MYSLVFAETLEKEKLPRIGFVKTYRTKQAAIDDCYRYVRLWNGWGDDAQQIYVDGTDLCIATAFESPYSGLIYATLSVKNCVSSNYIHR